MRATPTRWSAGVAWGALPLVPLDGQFTPPFVLVALPRSVAGQSALFVLSTALSNGVF